MISPFGKFPTNVCVFLLNLLRHDLQVPVGSLSRFNLSLPQCNVPGVLNCMSDRLRGFPIRVQTYARKSRGSLCSLPRKLTNVTPSGVKVNLAEKIIFFILLVSLQLIHFYCVALIL